MNGLEGGRNRLFVDEAYRLEDKEYLIDITEKGPMIAIAKWSIISTIFCFQHTRLANAWWW